MVIVGQLSSRLPRLLTTRDKTSDMTNQIAINTNKFNQDSLVGDRIDKLAFVSDLLLKEKSPVDQPQLLDVGCRDCGLKKYLPDHFSYKSADLFQNDDGTVDYVVDVSEGFPFENNSFDYVMALDILEHLDDLESGLEEVYRIANHKLLVILPNMSYWSHRASFLFKGHFNTSKYNLKYRGENRDSRLDRHRWVTVPPQSDQFMKDFSADKNIRLEIFPYFDRKSKKVFSSALKKVGLQTHLFSLGSLYILSKNATASD